jgi:hypothetical protein
MLFRNLSLQIGDAKPSATLVSHKRQIINNADFAADKAVEPPPSAAVRALSYSQNTSAVSFLVAWPTTFIKIRQMWSHCRRHWRLFL